MISDFSNSKIDNVITEYVHNRRDREILRLRWLDEDTYQAIGEKVGMSTRGVQYVVDRYRKKLLKYFK